MGALYEDVVGQERAIAQLRAAAAAPVHAYLLVGPAGVGKRALARSFAAQLLCGSGGCGSCTACANAQAERHPDLVVIERTGAFIAAEQAREIVRLASRSPVESERKVIVAVDFHLLRDDVWPMLLKTIEEPPASTIFVLLAEQVPPHLVTIASRCARVDLAALTAPQVVEALVAEGFDEPTAVAAAAAAAGRLDRARLLASDPEVAARRALWSGVPARLDGSGAAVAEIADQLLASLDSVLEPLLTRQAAELAAQDEQARTLGVRGGRKDVEDRHKREQRRWRTDELRAGLTALQAAYRDRIAAGGPAARAAVGAVDAITTLNEHLVRNPSEGLQLQALLVRLSQASG